MVAPGADPNSIHVAVEGASKLHIDRNGDLVLETQHGAIKTGRLRSHVQFNLCGWRRRCNLKGIATDNFEVPAMLYVAGYTTFRNFDVANAAQPKYAGDPDA